MRAYLLAVVALFAAVSHLVAAASSSSYEWNLFKQQHGKIYTGEEETMRLANFLATKERVERHNADPSATYKMRLNHMADWTAEEYERINGFKPTQVRDRPISPKLAELLEGPVPAEVDWRKSGRVSEVKDQGQCGSCWAFATTGLLEGQESVRNISKLISLSEQELVDCSQTNVGCNGGSILTALQDTCDIMSGLERESDYKYQGEQGHCNLNRTKIVPNITPVDGTYLKMGDERALLKAVANYGPVAVSIGASDNFKSYHSGVFTDSTCKNEPYSVNHSLLVVGYGTDPSGGDYWIVKNSWGPKWGEDGYIRMKRGANLCCIAAWAILADFE